MPTKGIIAPSDYTFNAAAKTITFAASYTGIKLGDIALITNVKSTVNTVIYDPSDSTKGGSISGLVLTLAFNTTGMNNSDDLQVIVSSSFMSVLIKQASDADLASQTTLNALLNAILAQNTSINQDNRFSVALDDIGTVLSLIYKLMARPMYLDNTGTIRTTIQNSQLTVLPNGGNINTISSIDISAIPIVKTRELVHFQINQYLKTT